MKQNKDNQQKSSHRLGTTTIKYKNLPVYNTM